MVAADRYDPRSKLERLKIRFVAIIATLTLIGLATGFALLVYEGVRKSRFDDITAGGIRMGRDVMNSIYNLDPIAAIFILPLVASMVMIGGMLIWRHFNR